MTAGSPTLAVHIDVGTSLSQNVMVTHTSQKIQVCNITNAKSTNTTDHRGLSTHHILDEKIQTEFS